MKYVDIVELLSDEKGVRKLVSQLKESKRVRFLDVLQDYQEGEQWLVNGFQDETRHSRRGAEMWKPFSKKRKHEGFKKGELKVWNLCSVATDTYKVYAKGSPEDSPHLYVTGDDTIDEGQLESTLFGDLNSFIETAVERYVVQGSLHTNINLEERNSPVWQAISQTEGVSPRVEILDAREVQPIYYYNALRGLIYFYNTDDKLYWEIWFYNDEGALEVRIFKEYKLLSERVEVGGVLPFYSQKKGISLNEMENSSKVAELLELQDDMNKHATTISKIFDNVALPILILGKDFHEANKGLSNEMIKEKLDNLSIAPGSISTFPLERLGAEGISDTQDKHIDRIMTQFYMITKIPKSLFDSSGMNSSGKALTQLSDSLKKVVSDIRDEVTRCVSFNVRVYLKSQGVNVDNLEIGIVYPPMTEITQEEKINAISSMNNLSEIPLSYKIEKVLELFGDEEKLDDILAEVAESDTAFKLALERNVNNTTL